MAGNTEENKATNSAYTRDHLANERTFLAWVRTSIGIMAFGFVVEKFAIFMKKLAYFLGKAELSKSLPVSSGYSAIFGIMLVALGALMGLLAFIRYKKIESEISRNSYKPSWLLDILVAMGILVIGIFLVFYMLSSIPD